MSTETPTTIPNTLPLPGGIPSTHRPHTESTTTILVHKDNTAFLNPVQQYNRDLSIACIRGWNEMRKEEAEAKWRKKQAGRQGKGKGKGKAKGPEDEGEGEGGAIAEGDGERTYKPQKFTILEALSATGLRSIRYAKEIPDVRYVLANDLSPSACEAMRMNVALNGVGEPMRRAGESSKGAAGAADAGAKADDSSAAAADGQTSTAELQPETAATAPIAAGGVEEESTVNGELSWQEQMDRVGRREECTGYVKINEGDACSLMYARRTPSARVDVVDLDPYGSASPFIDAAIGSIADGGLLAVTCTDLAVLAGSQYPEKALSQYGGVSVNAEYSHEVALRLVLHSLAVAAARYGRYITPLLSFSIDFYVRLFVRIDTGASKVKDLASQVGTVHVCNFCQTPTEQRFGKVVEKEDKNGNTQKTYRPQRSVVVREECEYCGGSLHLGGPMWLGPIQDPAFAERVLKGIEGDQDKYGTWTRMRGMLSLAGQELDVPFYFTTNRLHGMFHASSGAVSNTISALLNAGYKVSRSHASQGSLKTDAPRQFLFDMVREYAKTQPVRVDKIGEKSPARVLNAGEQVYEVDFTPHPDAKRLERGEQVFYQVNPTANWGPGTKARTVKTVKPAALPAAPPAAAAAVLPEPAASAPAEKRKAEPESLAGTAEGQGAKRVKSEEATAAVGAEADEEAAMNF